MQADPNITWWRPVSTPPAARGETSVPPGQSAPFWALMAFTVVLILAPQESYPALDSLHLAFVSATLAGGIYLLDRFLRRQPLIRLTRETVIAVILAGWCVATLPLSYWPGGSVDALTSLYLKALVVFWLLANVVNSERRFVISAWCLSLLAAPLAMSGVWSMLTGGFLNEELSHGTDRIRGYNSSLTQNPNDLALMLNLILPLSVALFLAAKRPAVRGLLVLLICGDVAAIIATFSRGGFLVLGIICLCYVWRAFQRGKRGLAATVAALALAGVSLLPSGYLGRMGTITDIQADQTGSAQARWGDSLAAVEFIAAHPIVGAGIGNDVLALNEVRGSTWTKVHDVYLEYGVDLGLPGLGLFLLLLLGTYQSARYARESGTSDGSPTGFQYLAQGLMVSLTAFAAAAFFYPDAYQFYFYYIAGLAVAAKSIAKLPHETVTAAANMVRA